MKAWIAVVAATPQNRIAKYLDFDTQAEAQAHCARFPPAFAAPNPGGGVRDWRVSGNTLTLDPFTDPAADAEAARRAAIRADTTRATMLDTLRTATAAQIGTFVDSNVTDLAGARTMFKRILLLIALDPRD